jgi:hypothetical protein
MYLLSGYMTTKKLERIGAKVVENGPYLVEPSNLMIH